MSQVDFNKLDSQGRNMALKDFMKNLKGLDTKDVWAWKWNRVSIFRWYQGKSIIAPREFNTKDNSAYTIFFDQANNKVSEGKVLNKLFEGSWKYYHQASQIVMTIENYKDGKLKVYDLFLSQW
jgi:hypothetical protein